MIFPVTYRQLLDDSRCDALLQEYAEECSLAELGKINPDREAYAAMEASGGMQCFGVYGSAGLVGFANLLIWTVPHYSKRIASTESIFIARANRNRGAGGELRRVLKAFAKSKDCFLIQYTAPVGSRFARYLARHKECRHSNDVYVECL
jgi:hypothetical protein